MELDVGLDLAVIVQPLVLSLVVEVAGGADDGVEAGAVVEGVKLGCSGGDLEEIISLRSILFHSTHYLRFIHFLLFFP